MMKTISGLILFLLILQGTGFATFTSHSDGTISDSKTQLMWMNKTADINNDGSLDDTDKTSWVDAIHYCETLEFAGYSDWRMPNVKEISLISDKNESQPSVPPCFDGVIAGYYWSSTTLISNTQVAWFINLYAGQLDTTTKDFEWNVIAVRGGQ